MPGMKNKALMISSLSGKRCREVPVILSVHGAGCNRKTCKRYCSYSKANIPQPSAKVTDFSYSGLLTALYHNFQYGQSMLLLCSAMICYVLKKNFKFLRNLPVDCARIVCEIIIYRFIFLFLSLRQPPSPLRFSAGEGRAFEPFPARGNDGTEGTYI